MFQTFEVTARPEQGPPRLAALRGQVARAGLDGFLVPRTDAHQGEYVAPCDARLEWLTGFTGSAGFCAVLAEVAGIFVDGRYRTQVKAQVAEDFTPVPWPEVKLADWLKDRLPGGGRVGFDPWLHSAAALDEAREALQDNGIDLIAHDNLVDRIWSDRPAPPMAPVKPHPLEFAGESASDKRNRLAAGLREAGQRAAVLTLPDSIMWLLNIRGGDIERNPVALCFAILHDDGRVDLFIAPQKVSGLADHLGATVTIRPENAFAGALADLAGPARYDPATAPVAVAEALGPRGVRGADPCLLPKACKNPAEIDGSAAAHLRDGAAVVECLAWLDAQPPGT
ncbi:MAG: aminopeptidase P family N-terminal domain-containing protein, partial [Marinibacterium sp.]